jgi:hypothetical protein
MEIWHSDYNALDNYWTLGATAWILKVTMGHKYNFENAT